MAIFKKKKPDGFTNPKKVIGAFLPLDLIAYLNLYAIDNACSNGAVIEELLTKWKSNNETVGLNETQLLVNITSQGVEAWGTLKAENKKLQISKFLKDLEEELVRKKLDAKSIALIMEGVKNGIC